jgi:hypothetical protein
MKFSVGKNSYATIQTRFACTQQQQGKAAGTAIFCRRRRAIMRLVSTLSLT